MRPLRASRCARFRRQNSRRFPRTCSPRSRRSLYNGRILHDFRQPMTALLLAEASNPLQSVVEFLLRGGLFMWPLLICSIVALTVIILRSDGFAPEERAPAGDRERDRAPVARWKSRAPFAHRAGRRLLARPHCAGCPATSARAALGKYRSGRDPGPPRDGHPGARPDSARDHHRHRAVVRLDRRGLGPGARLFPSRSRDRRSRHAKRSPSASPRRSTPRFSDCPSLSQP